MGLIRRRPFWHGPESIHQSSWTVRIFVGKPPLRRERGMSVEGESLEISDPVVGTEGSISIGDVAGFCKVERLRRGEPGGVAIAALIRLAAAEVEAIPLLGCDRSTVHEVLGPFGSGLDPLDQLLSMPAPLRVFLRMKQDVAGKLQGDDLVQVVHAGNGILEIASPYVIGYRIFLKPVPGSGPHSCVTANIALPQAYEFIEQHDGLNHVGRI